VTVRAMCITDYGRPLELLEVPRPRPDPGFALIKVLACGLCFSDVKTIRGNMPYSASLRLPHVAGHEVSGRIVEVNGPSQFQPGDRVVVYHLWGCRRCGSCRRGEEHLCTAVVAWMGFTHPGGFQEYLVAPVEYLLPVPESISPTAAPALTCAMGTAYRAVAVRGAVLPGEHVVVLGLGGVGLHAALIAQASGARVLGIDIGEAKLAGARKAGVRSAAEGHEVMKQLLEMTGGEGADAVIETTGVPTLLETGRQLLRPGGRIVAVGYHVGETMEVSSDRLVLEEQSVIGSRYAARIDMERVIRMVADGTVTPVISDVIPLERLNEAVERLEAGAVIGRLVLEVARDST
jgi:2-desacetyl-2-hydroxyethyl bacteriochlorophyllide A dehydrogenase